MMASRIQRTAATARLMTKRTFATAAPAAAGGRNHKVVVVGGGSAGMNISHQLVNTGRFSQDDIAIVDPAEWHDYQPGWTLVGGGLKTKEELRRPLDSLVDGKIKLYREGVDKFEPEQNSVTLGSQRLTYEHLVVAPGIKVDFSSIKGLPEALADRDAPVASIYGYDSVSKLNPLVQTLAKGQALFTQPAGGIKCAGAPQKAMWLALDHWKRAGLYQAGSASSPVRVTFASGLGGMFAVPKYAAKLEQLRQERGVEGLFQHDLVEVNGDKAVFAHAPSGERVTRQFDLLHAVPKMGPHAFVRDSPLADGAGYVEVDQNTAQHVKYANVWSSGDASSLPTSKTAAAITAQAPVIVGNILAALDGGVGTPATPGYDGYTSCPLLTEYGKVLLAEFKYGGVPKETFGDLVGFDQAEPRRFFYHLKKDFFPWVYYNSMVKGTWGGPKGWLK